MRVAEKGDGMGVMQGAGTRCVELAAQPRKAGIHLAGAQRVDEPAERRELVELSSGEQARERIGGEHEPAVAWVEALGSLHADLRLIRRDAHRTGRRRATGVAPDRLIPATGGPPAPPAPG